VVDFEVLNESQKKWVEERILRDLERAYNDKLGTKCIRLEVSVRPAEQTEQKIYMPEEKAQDLMGRNPEVREFIKDLGLDTK
jgi:chromosomal replication initiation ATPase DnaA